MNRRDFSRFSLAAVGGVFMGRRWYQQGRGLIVPEQSLILSDLGGWRPLTGSVLAIGRVPQWVRVTGYDPLTHSITIERLGG